MLVPVLCAYLLSHVAPYSLFIVLLVCAILCFIAYRILVWRGQHGKLPQHAPEQAISTSDTKDTETDEGKKFLEETG